MHNRCAITLQSIRYPFETIAQSFAIGAQPIYDRSAISGAIKVQLMHNRCTITLQSTRFPIEIIAQSFAIGAQSIAK
jgi:SUMO ligase MMS21 Smc5/6 complex component